MKQNNSIRWFTKTVALLNLLFGLDTAHAAPAGKAITPEQREFFENKIRPVLVKECYDCHSEERGKNKGELTVDTRDGIRAGGDRGPAVVPGKPEESILINAIRQVGQLRMPPDSRGGILPDDVIADFEKWVKEGAPDPRDSAKIVSDRTARPEKEVNWEQERQYWAFKKPKAVAPPKVANEKWPKTEVDRFVLAKLESKGLKPVRDADKRTRRTDRPAPTKNWWIRCWPHLSLASNGGATGWTWRGTANPPGWTAI